MIVPSSLGRKPSALYSDRRQKQNSFFRAQRVTPQSFVWPLSALPRSLESSLDVHACKVRQRRSSTITKVRTDGYRMASRPTGNANTIDSNGVTYCTCARCASIYICGVGQIRCHVRRAAGMNSGSSPQRSMNKPTRYCICCEKNVRRPPRYTDRLITRYLRKVS